MGKTIDQFVNDYNGKLINFGGVQCGAVFNQYNRDVVEGGWIPTPLTGYVIDMWTLFGSDADYGNYEKIDGSQPVQKGDVVLWSKYNGVGLPHVAIALEDHGNTIRCFTQNPGNARIEDLPKRGIVGYMRPKKFIGQHTPAPAPVASQPGQREYIVQPGDALSLIGERFGVDYNEIARLSGVADVNHIEVGQKLIIPAGNAPAPASGRVTYIVQPGDMLSVIGERYGVDYHVIAQQSGIANPDLIYPGQELVIHP